MRKNAICACVKSLAHMCILNVRVCARARVFVCLLNDVRYITHLAEPWTVAHTRCSCVSVRARVRARL